MVAEDLQPSVASPDKGVKALKWAIFVEKAGVWGEADFIKNGFVDHINTTKDVTDYLWYTTRFVLLKRLNPILIGENVVFVTTSYCFPLFKLFIALGKQKHLVSRNLYPGFG